MPTQLAKPQSIAADLQLEREGCPMSPDCRATVVKSHGNDVSARFSRLRFRGRRFGRGV